MNNSKGDSRTPDFPSWARWRPNELIVQVHAQPAARSSAICGEHGQRLKISLHAPPLEGKANEELLRFLAQELKLRRSCLRLLLGAASREKAIAIQADEGAAREIVARLAQRLAQA